MTKRRTTLRGVALVAGLAAAGLVAGCGDRLPTAPVTGKVTLNGEALTSGTVVFQSEKHGILAKGEIQSDGSYTLWTYNEKSPDGAVLGKHKVAVQAFKETGAAPTGSDQEVPQKPAAVPRNYILPSTSGIIKEVEDRENDIPIKLVGQVPP